jgi:hypothetical protein
LIIKTRILTLSLAIFLSSILLIGIISSSSYAYAQQSSQRSNQKFPPSIIAASSTDTTPHALKLKATLQGEDGQPKKVSGFKIDLKNVVTAQINSQVLVFVTDSSLQVIGAKIRTISGQLIDLVPSTTIQTNAFSLAGLPIGVYTLDIITQKGNTKAAYEGILVISQQPTTVINETTKNVINQEINQNTRVDTDIIIKDVFKPKTKKVVDKERICLFTPNHPDCKPKDAKCPKGWSMNEDEYCFPAHKSCPEGYWRADDDESGACVKKPKDIVPVPIDLPLCDGSYQRCITEEGNVCEPGSTEHECEAEGVLCNVPGVEGCHTYQEGVCIDCEEEPEDPCDENPESEECQPEDPCIDNPNTEGCQEPLPPTDSCEENPSLPECQQEDIGAAFASEEPIDEGDDADEGDEGNGASSDDEAGDESNEEVGEEEAAPEEEPTPTPEAEEDEEVVVEEEEEAATVIEEDSQAAVEICNNTLDDDGDGLVDTQDTEDCPMTEAPEEAAPIPTPTPELEEEEEEAAPEEELIPTPTPTPELEEEEEEAAPEEEETFVEEPIDEGDDADEGDEGNGASSDDEAGDEEE